MLFSSLSVSKTEKNETETMKQTEDTKHFCEMQGNGNLGKDTNQSGGGV